MQLAPESVLLRDPTDGACAGKTVGQTLIDSSMATGPNEKTLDWESQGLKFSETDSPLALFYVVAISLDLVEPSPKSIHVFAFIIALPAFGGKDFLPLTLCQDRVTQVGQGVCACVFHQIDGQQ